MGTYVCGQTIYSYFLTYVQQGDPSETIMPQNFSQGVIGLKIGWTDASS